MKTMKDETMHIRQLIGKFMNGETTIAEEQALYDYFSSDNVAKELADWKDYFLALGLLREKDAELQKANDSSPSAKVVRLKHYVIVRRIAVAVVIIAIGMAAGMYFDHSRNYCEAYVYGKRVTDKAVVMKEMKTTLQHIDADDQPTVDDQLRDVLM